MDWWQTLTSTVASEFSDLNDLEDTVRVSIRLLLAALLGGVLGYERETKGKSAGLRTHMLVCVGASLFVVVPLQAGLDLDQLARVIQGIVTGIGFLGAGTILKGNSVRDVHGLTTAAGIWLTAAIGIACGLGREATAVLATVLALMVLMLMPALERNAERTYARRSDEERERGRAPPDAD
ncbi:MgtC/SapB family protein [Stutzerimonas azotifigens]|uniref:MgtC/SapB family protein n=1 Tax=Stutzerimonas azotifigens TaxID=291995 RepID=UPI000418467C|nr:MgtC/SapB family protein [Stutzerimonas azotifigens]